MRHVTSHPFVLLLIEWWAGAAMRTTGEPSEHTSSQDSAGQQAIRDHIEAVIASPTLSSSPRRAQLLRYLCARTLDGAGDQVNEYAIGVDVFDKPASFDPRIDSIVRTEMGRLRQKLKEYYAGESRPSTVRIELPLRSYVPVFTFGVDQGTPSAPPAAVKRSSPPRMATVIAIVLGVVLAGLVMWRILGGNGNAAGETIAVLPFLNLTGDSGQDYLGDSLTDELTETLAESKDLRVVARTSAFQFKGKGEDVRAIGRALNAGSVLEGSISRREGKFRVVVQLIRSSDGYHLWSRTYDATSVDLARVETEIAVSTEQALMPARKAVTQARSLTSTNPEAHDLYMRAIYQIQQHNADSLREGLRLAQEAVRVDPEYSRAYFAIARAETTLSAIGVISGREALELGRAAAKKALALDPQFSDARAYTAHATYVYDWNWPEAEKEYALAFQGEGSHGQAHSLYGWGLMTRKRFDEARGHLQTAEELDPQSPNPRQNLVTDWIFERNFPAAKREVAGIFKLYPKSIVGIRDLGWVAILEKDCPTARSSAQTAAEWYPEQGDRTGSPTMKIACGQPEEARRQLEKMARDAEKEFVSPYALAQGYASLGDADHALEYLQKSAGARESVILYLAIDTLFDPVREDPRFIALEKEVGLIP
jgi:adenylate cyclase